ncbi:MAG: 4Fe-4S binding protein, partial [Deltaproteobacteria bacterium]|nr:4Fe-4S binding protein [Deltaproteobacteria bacterium]
MNSAPQPSPQPPSPLRRLLRLTNARLASQAVFLGLFVFFIWAGWTSRLAGFPVSWLLELDPLTALATALSGGTLYRGLGWSLLVVALTFVFGRVFCNWICPFGTLHQLAGWLFNTRGNRERIAQNEYRRRQYLKYSLLVALLVMAALGVLQTGLLDPIATVYRGWALTVAPAADMAAGRLGAPEWMLFAPGVKERVFTGSFWAGLFFLGLLALNIRWPRFFCRVLCPLGALLGVLSRLALFRINRDPALCNGCNVCLTRCEGASDPHSVLRLSECLACMNCLDDCHEGALRYTMLGLDKTQVNPAPDMGRRRLLFAGLGGLLAVPLLKGNGWTDDSNYSPLMIRPPGSLPERSFLARCIKCEQCVNVCPTNVLQPATLAEGGIEALWTPVLRFNIAHCQLKCTLCSEVCPTGAIRHITTAEK